MWKILATCLSLIPFQAAIIWILLRCIFGAGHVNRDVLMAAITVNILSVAQFVPIYGTREALRPGSFLDNATGQPVFWQQLIYFSVVALTTAGCGDILPVSAWARALANREQVVGVLYVAVLMGRGVGLFSPNTQR